MYCANSDSDVHGPTARVLWVGVFKQGGVLSVVLFCVNVDELLLILSAAGVVCYTGSTFVGALAYAGDIVLNLSHPICPAFSPQTM